jgi:hypothetical protein
MGGRPVSQTHDVLLLNPDKIDWLEAASDEEIGLGDALELTYKVDPHAKDMTGELMA